MAMLAKVGYFIPSFIKVPNQFFLRNQEGIGSSPAQNLKCFGQSDVNWSILHKYALKTESH